MLNDDLCPCCAAPMEGSDHCPACYCEAHQSHNPGHMRARVIALQALLAQISQLANTRSTL